MAKLTSAEVKKLVKEGKPGKHSDGDRLYLQVFSPGVASWSVKVQVKGQTRTTKNGNIVPLRVEPSAGSYADTTLAQARDKAFEYRKLARSGVNPLDYIKAEREKKKRKDAKAAMPTLEGGAHILFEQVRKGFKRDDIVRKAGWMGRLEKHVFPVMGNKQINEITKDDILDLFIKEITPTEKHNLRETRRRIRYILEDIFEWAEDERYIKKNPMNKISNKKFKKIQKLHQRKNQKPGKHRALPYRDISKMLEIVNLSGAAIATKLCLNFVVLTATRTSEATGAMWSEIDLERRMWTIPVERLKVDRVDDEEVVEELRVALSESACDVIERAKILKNGSDLVFPSPDKRCYGKPISNVTMMNLLRRYEISEGVKIAEVTTVHGFRSSFTDWGAENGIDDHLIETALGHKVPGVKGRYKRTDRFDERGPVMTEWAEQCYSPSPD